MSSSHKDGHGRCVTCGDEGEARRKREADAQRADDREPADVRRTTSHTSELRPGCITARSLLLLAERLSQLGMAHTRAGGKPEDAPCLVQLSQRRVFVRGRGGTEGSTTYVAIARVRSGGSWFTLACHGDGWSFE